MLRDVYRLHRHGAGDLEGDRERLTLVHIDGDSVAHTCVTVLGEDGNETRSGRGCHRIRTIVGSDELDGTGEDVGLLGVVLLDVLDADIVGDVLVAGTRVGRGPCLVISLGVDGVIVFDFLHCLIGGESSHRQYGNYYHCCQCQFRHGFRMFFTSIKKATE